MEEKLKEREGQEEQRERTTEMEKEPPRALGHLTADDYQKGGPEDEVEKEENSAKGADRKGGHHREKGGRLSEKGGSSMGMPWKESYKRTICRHWERGRCDRGTECAFAHGEEDKGNPVPIGNWEYPKGGGKGKEGDPGKHRGQGKSGGTSHKDTKDNKDYRNAKDNPDQKGKSRVHTEEKGMHQDRGRDPGRDRGRSREGREESERGRERKRCDRNDRQSSGDRSDKRKTRERSEESHEPKRRTVLKEKPREERPRSSRTIRSSSSSSSSTSESERPQKTTKAAKKPEVKKPETRKPEVKKPEEAKIPKQQGRAAGGPAPRPDGSLPKATAAARNPAAQPTKDKKSEMITKQELGALREKASDYDALQTDYNVCHDEFENQKAACLSLKAENGALRKDNIKNLKEKSGLEQTLEKTQEELKDAYRELQEAHRELAARGKKES